MKMTWQPEWATSNRKPDFVDNDDGGASNRGIQYGWARMPAVDILKLQANEGESYGKNLKLLFAASGDLRNVIKTVGNIPATYNGSISVTVNDRDFNTVGRNALVLLVALAVPDDSAAVYCMLHLNHSSMNRQGDLDLLNTNVRPLIQDVVDKIAGKAAETLQKKTWKFGANELCLTLSKTCWVAMLSLLEVPPALTTKSAQRAYTDVTMARKDSIESQYMRHSPAHRVCKEQFRKDGILLPFGNSREAFTIPNPMFFQGVTWRMRDYAEDFEGWDLAEVLHLDSGLATNDLYGKIFVGVKAALTRFRGVLNSRASAFALTNLQAMSLSDSLPHNTFTRIEYCKVSDRGNPDTAKVLERLGPLLQNPRANAHATLLTLFTCAVVQMSPEPFPDSEMKLEVARVDKLMPLTIKMLTGDGGVWGVRMQLLTSATLLVRDNEKYFSKYMQRHKFNRAAQANGMAMKEPHTIIDKWPLRSKMSPDQEGAKEEFKTRLASTYYGRERYVEWQRTI
ncbi:hypothetical protein LTR56_006131 [Elasticomyces elasticus]|nr:hypothetical protein LTR56_006131 [Elasticomyces elasticus]KAK3667607.1 hypothetical protein LTR22_001422 [Elasticomyces elasticus]KAK4928437.1 hypothetical protein LTR49_004844 [Elasticomyces elasticus]KAK5767238.1 hypothetical protein LTS12_002696 [Elasticomyces elasticus]